MRLCGGFLRFEQLSCTKQGHQSGSTAGESVHSAFLPIDDADGNSTLQTSLPERFQGFQGGSAGGDDVLDETYALARFVVAFEPLLRPVLLRRLAHNQEGQAGRERRCRRQRNRPQLGTGQPHRVRLVLGDGGCEVLAERGEQVRPGLEAILVEVIARAAPRPKHEVAFEIGVLAERGGELFPSHDRATRTAWRASGIKRVAWGESPSTETIEPSPK